MNSIDIAYKFYKRHIYDEEKIRLLEEHNLKVAGSVPSVLWELFGSLLTGRTGAGSTGADLVGWEVKSAKTGGSYEYQYHLNTGVAKLKEDCIVCHLFCSYSETYKDVLVSAIPGKKLAPIYFKKWKPLYRKNYDKRVPASRRRQRFRKSISSGYVNKNGIIILDIKDGEILKRNDQALQKLNSNI